MGEGGEGWVVRSITESQKRRGHRLGGKLTSLILDFLDLGALGFPGRVQQLAVGSSGLALRRRLELQGRGLRVKDVRAKCEALEA